MDQQSFTISIIDNVFLHKPFQNTLPHMIDTVKKMAHNFLISVKKTSKIVNMMTK